MLKKPLFWLGLALMVTIICLYPCLLNDWLNWDDPDYILNNQIIRDCSFNGIKKMFTTAHVIGAYVPMVLVSWSIDYALGGLNPLWFHATNLLLHLTNVGLVFLLIKTMTNRVMIAFITALLFGIHPMHVETVAWVTARKDLIYTYFL